MSQGWAGNQSRTENLMQEVEKSLTAVLWLPLSLGLSPNPYKLSFSERFFFLPFSLSVFSHFLCCSFPPSQAIDSHLVLYLLPALSLCQECYPEMPFCFLHPQPLNQGELLQLPAKVPASYWPLLGIFLQDEKREWLKCSAFITHTSSPLRNR